MQSAMKLTTLSVPTASWAPRPKRMRQNITIPATALNRSMGAISVVRLTRKATRTLQLRPRERSPLQTPTTAGQPLTILPIPSTWTSRLVTRVIKRPPDSLVRRNRKQGSPLWPVKQPSQEWALEESDLPTWTLSMREWRTGEFLKHNYRQSPQTHPSNRPTITQR